MKPPSLATVTKIEETGKPDERKEPISAPQVFFFLLMDRAPEIGCVCVCVGASVGVACSAPSPDTYTLVAYS